MTGFKRHATLLRAAARRLLAETADRKIRTLTAAMNIVAYQGNPERVNREIARHLAQTGHIKPGSPDYDKLHEVDYMAAIKSTLHSTGVPMQEWDDIIQTMLMKRVLTVPFMKKMLNSASTAQAASFIKMTVRNHIKDTWRKQKKTLSITHDSHDYTFGTIQVDSLEAVEEFDDLAPDLKADFLAQMFKDMPKDLRDFLSLAVQNAHSRWGFSHGVANLALFQLARNHKLPSSIDDDVEDILYSLKNQPRKFADYLHQIRIEDGDKPGTLYNKLRHVGKNYWLRKLRPMSERLFADYERQYGPDVRELAQKGMFIYLGDG